MSIFSSVFKAKSLVSFVPILLLAGCTQKHITTTAIDFNKSIAESSQKEILLNAVRASKGYPLTYSAITGGSGALSRASAANVNPTILNPLGEAFRLSQITGPITATATLDHSATISNLNSNEVIGKMLAPVEPDLYKLFVDTGFDKELVNLLFLRSINLTSSTYKSLVWKAEQRCRRLKGLSLSRQLRERDVDLCDAIQAGYQEIEEIRDQAVTDGEVRLIRICEAKHPKFNRVGLNAEDVLFFPNVATEKCDYLGFVTLYRTLRVLGFGAKTTGSERTLRRTEVSTKIVNNLNDKSKSTEETTTTRAIQDARSVRLELSGASGVELSLKDNEDSENSVVLRTPQEMIEYLGELVVAQLKTTDDYTPEIIFGIERQRAPLFKIVRGKIENSVITVVDDEGERFSVPRPVFADREAHQTLRVVKMLSEIISLQTRREDLPNTTTIAFQ